MSTTFGIKIAGQEELVPVAFRSSKSIVFTNPIAHLLADDVPVVAMDNTSQGIETIGDINTAIAKEKQEVM